MHKPHEVLSLSLRVHVRQYNNNNYFTHTYIRNERMGLCVIRYTHGNPHSMSGTTGTRSVALKSIPLFSLSFFQSSRVVLRVQRELLCNAIRGRVDGLLREFILFTEHNKQHTIELILQTLPDTLVKFLSSLPLSNRKRFANAFL